MTSPIDPVLPKSDPALMDFLHRVVTPGEEDPDPFAVLSDEEIVAIDGEIVPEFSVLPWIEEQSDLPEGAFGRFGERSLVLRGLVELSADAGHATVHATQTEPLAMAMAARRSGAAMIRMTSTLADRRTACITSVQAHHGAVEEVIGPEGVHYFTALDHQGVLHRMTSWALTTDLDRRASGSRVISETQWYAWVVNELGVDAHHVQIDLHAPSDNGHGMYDEHWLVVSSAEAAVVVENVGDNALRVEATSTPQLASRLGDRIARALATQAP